MKTFIFCLAALVCLVAAVNAWGYGPPCGGKCGANASCNRKSNKCVCNKCFKGWMPHKGCRPVKCGANARCNSGTGKCVCNRCFSGNANSGCSKIPCCGKCGRNASCDRNRDRCICKNCYRGNAKTGCTRLNCYRNAYCNNSKNRCVCKSGCYNWVKGKGCKRGHH